MREDVTPLRPGRRRSGYNEAAAEAIDGFLAATPPADARPRGDALAARRGHVS